MVDALEEGKIMRVSEGYAKKEGLTILRRHEPKNYLEREKQSQPIQKIGIEGRAYKKSLLSFEELRKPLDWRKNQVVQELVEDFHWVIGKARRERNLTRKQFANLIHEHEETIKKLENGIVPTNDFILINKVQDYLHINLRKDKQNFSESARLQLTLKNQEKELAEKKQELKEVDVKVDEKFSGDDIDIIGEEPEPKE